MQRRMARHDLAIRMIVADPRRIGLENAVFSAGDLIFWDGIRMVKRPDALIYTRDNTIHLVEYKLNDSPERKSRALSQLTESSDILSQSYHGEIRLHYAHEDFNVEEAGYISRSPI